MQGKNKWKLRQDLGFGVEGLAGMEKKMETTRGFRVWRLGFIRNGKENGNY